MAMGFWTFVGVFLVFVGNAQAFNESLLSVSLFLLLGERFFVKYSVFREEMLNLSMWKRERNSLVVVFWRNTISKAKITRL